jgi:hypothetical protein
VKETHSVELIKLLMQSVNEKGIEKTKNILKQGIENGYETGDRLMSFTIQAICRNFQISESELFLGRSRKNGTRTKARAMLIFMFFNNLDLSQSKISKIFNINKASTSRDIKYMNSLSHKFVDEKKQLDLKHKINKEIELFVENNI